jgi:hypothetical protein
MAKYGHKKKAGKKITRKGIKQQNIDVKNM